MFRTFNMGIGMVLICSQFDADTVAHQVGTGFDIGSVVTGDRDVRIQ
jgi:phosphoribosylaminoimidazole (AIR) synthetase